MVFFFVCHKFFGSGPLFGCKLFLDVNEYKFQL